MSRYIDAKLIEPFFKRGEWDTPDERWRPESEFVRFIDAIPTAEVAEVVRCKECVFHSDSFILNGKRKCNIFCMCTEDGFYCGFGEKMDEVGE